MFKINIRETKGAINNEHSRETGNIWYTRHNMKASQTQSTTLVDQLANTGTCNTQGNEVSLKSIVNNSTNIEDVFPSSKE
jgi:hypothetical protein